MKFTACRRLYLLLRLHRPKTFIHLTRDCHAPLKIEELLLRCSQHFADVLECRAG